MDSILEALFKDVPRDKTYEINNLQDANMLIIQNTQTYSRKLIEYTKSFQQLLNTLTNNFSGACDKHSMIVDQNEEEQELGDDKQSFVQMPSNHNWVLEGNYFCTFVRPFILKQHYDTVKNYIDFEKFLQSDIPNHANQCVRAKNYYYWPNMQVSFFGWRQYLYMKFLIDIGPTIPIIHNNSLGPVNLFVIEPDAFLNVELCLCLDNDQHQVLFVNGRHKFNNTNETLFKITMADGSQATCKVFDEWTYSNKNFFDYIRDNINLKQCITLEKYKSIINVNLQSLRTFDDNNNGVDSYTTKDATVLNRNALKATPIISASSENAEFIQTEIDKALAKINENMVKVLANCDYADDPNILQKYFEQSNFTNYDYVIFVVWKKLTAHEEFSYKETDIKLFLELICESIFVSDKDNLIIALNKCEPYIKLEKTIFNRLCNHWTFFNDENPYMTLGYFFGIHYKIYLKLTNANPELEHREAWAYTFENVMASEIAPEILCKGYLKKIEIFKANLVFNGKNYDVVKQGDELYKLTSKMNSTKFSGVKLNNWKYLYFTNNGVYNVFTNDFHSSCPFILGSTLPHSFKRPTDSKYLNEAVFNYMLDTSCEEKNIFRVYHIAKICRDVKMLKTDLAIVFYLGKCNACQGDMRARLNDLFRELWNLNDEDLITMAMYLKIYKVSDILHNFKCNACRSNIASSDDGHISKKCKCYLKIKVDRRALKICLIVDLFGNDADLCELMWILIFNTKPYVSALLVRTQSEFVGKHAEFFLSAHAKLIRYLYRLIHKIEFADMLMATLADKHSLMRELRDNVACEQPDGQQLLDDNSNNISKFYAHHMNTTMVLSKYNVWWDKIILARERDDLSAWLTRFYIRVILSKMDLSEYSYNYLKKVVNGYLYFKRFTNFNNANSMMMLHFAASLGIPSDYGKKAIYLPGDPGSGKSSFFELLDYIVLMHKHDCAKYGLSNKETDEMEVNKLTSQLYVINEMKMCDDSFFKSSADSSKSDSKCRKYEGGLKYEANYKLLIVNNKPLYIIDYDKAVHNRFAIVYTDHTFIEDMKFEGSIYAHIKSKRFPAENVYYEALVQPVRLFLSHVLMYKRDPKYGFIQYKNILKYDPIHKHNLLCLDTNNSPVCALIYILNIKVTKNTNSATISEDKMEEMIISAIPYLETFLHPLFFKCTKNNVSSNGNSRGGGGNNKASYCLNEQILLAQIKEKFKNNYNSNDNKFFNLSIALSKNEMNTNKPIFKC
ncbi:DNA helicase [Lonomia obliqua multiple nucleopolyhedrovirus]|uniref:DNA helicase n=1 Tax=Lonomia obliqua multiple nucleopolyhedrovirus TaxID=134394 RepID=A0A126FC44_9ABAC|nr:DNA helicase [Lonomia obliqua multiple nucleopolyhedrovirus]AKN80970.1 DNA helicase [Lonomia obliqua multiple nucleopolyhedrovirus]